MSTPNAKSGGAGFKKTVFTPCRRIGLSRKIKTPSVGTPTSGTPPIPDSVGVETPQKCIETPKRNITKPKVTKTSEKPLIRKALENEKQANQSDKNVEASKHKSEPKVTQLPDPKVTQLPDPKATQLSEQKSVEAPVGETSTRLERKLQCKALASPVNNESLKSTNKKKLETKKKIPVKECTVRLDIDNKSSVLVSDSKQNIVSPKRKIEAKKSGRETRKPVKRLSMKKSISSSSEDFSDDEFRKSKSSGSNSQEIVPKKDDDEIVCKPKRRRAVLSSSEDEDFVASQGSNKEKVEKDLRVKVQELSEKIQQKTLQLQDLQQASVYRNLHKVKELGELTQKWKNGCEDAVRMLHKNLQNHGPISMLSLLEKLNVPSEFLSYNTDNDVFS